MKPHLFDTKQVYLIRHGLSTLNKRGYGKRKLDADLLPQGIPAVQKIAEFLRGVPDSYNISSPLPRCRQTSEIISKTTKKSFRFDKRLTEFYHESFTDFRFRISDFLEDLSSVPENNIIICTHGAVIAGIKHLIIGNKFTYANRADYPLEGMLLIIKKNRCDDINFNSFHTDITA